MLSDPYMEAETPEQLGNDAFPEVGDHKVPRPVLEISMI